MAARTDQRETTTHDESETTPRRTPGQVPWDDRAWHGERPWPAVAVSPEHMRHENPTVSMAFVKHEAFLIGMGIATVALLGLIVALFLAGGAGLLLMGMLIAVYIGFLTIPMWLAALHDDAEDHPELFEERTDDPTP